MPRPLPVSLCGHSWAGLQQRFSVSDDLRREVERLIPQPKPKTSFFTLVPVLFAIYAVPVWGWSAIPIVLLIGVGFLLWGQLSGRDQNARVNIDGQDHVLIRLPKESSYAVLARVLGQFEPGDLQLNEFVPPALELSEMKSAVQAVINELGATLTHSHPADVLREMRQKQEQYAAQTDDAGLANAAHLKAERLKKEEDLFLVAESQLNVLNERLKRIEAAERLLIRLMIEPPSSRGDLRFQRDRILANLKVSLSESSQIP